MKSTKIWIIVILIAFFPEIGNTCSCDPSSLSQFEGHPENYPIIVMGEINQEGNKVIMRPVKSWTGDPGDVTFHTATFCGYHYEKNKKYLVLATDSKEISSCNSELLKFSPANTYSYIEKLAKMKNFVGEINPSWQFCTKNNECVQTKNKCGKPIVVNEKYQKDYSDFLTTYKVDCSKEDTNHSEKPNGLSCIENFCSYEVSALESILEWFKKKITSR